MSKHAPAKRREIDRDSNVTIAFPLNDIKAVYGGCCNILHPKIEFNEDDEKLNLRRAIKANKEAAEIILQILKYEVYGR